MLKLLLITVIFVISKETQGAEIEDLSKCKPPEAELKKVHDACKASWRDLYTIKEDIPTVNKLANQCPYFCTHEAESCVWRIGCKRCRGLLGVCRGNVAACDAYIKVNKLKSDEERCPQYEFCKVGLGHMEAIRLTCEDIYKEWNQKAEAGATVVDLPDRCSKFCSREEEDCSWRIVCRKCGILAKILQRTSPVSESKFKAIIAKKEGERCNQYKGEVFPFWWFSGDWF